MAAGAFARLVLLFSLCRSWLETHGGQGGMDRAWIRRPQRPQLAREAWAEAWQFRVEAPGRGSPVWVWWRLASDAAAAGEEDKDQGGAARGA